MNQMERRSLLRELCTYQDLLREWLVEGKRVNLPMKFTGTEELVPFEQIAFRCLLAWEGPLDKSRVYALPDVKPVIAAMIYPLHDFIEYLAFSKKILALPEDALEKPTKIKRFLGLSGKVERGKNPAVTKAIDELAEDFSLRAS